MEIQSKDIWQKRDQGTDRMMRNFLTHANHEWRGQRPTSARIQDPKNQEKIKKEEGKGCSHELGQSDGEVERLSEVVGDIEGLGKPGKDS